jgi:transcriptional regulator with XRE-family HTH domain
MSFRAWRADKQLSQERVADISGLSLRTVQRLDAGHRVSYASLRALAAAFDGDVDALERELYAVNKPTEDFVEMPRWVRLLDDTRRFGGAGLSRRDVHWVEAFCIACAAMTFVASLLVSSNVTAQTVRAGAAVALACAYLVSVFARIGDVYQRWPNAGHASPESQPLIRTWRSRSIGYAYLAGAGILGAAMFYWLVL